MVASVSCRVRRARRPRHTLSWRAFKSTKLVPAFKELRALGIYARNDHIQFCSSDAHCHLRLAANGVPEGTPNRHLKALEFMKKQDRGDENSYVGYHLQDIPMGKEEWDEPFDGIYLLHALKPEETKPVRDVFVKRGLAVEWSGETDVRILVRPPKAVGPLWAKLRAHVKTRCIFWRWHGLAAHLHADPEASAKRQRSNIRYDASAPDAPPAGMDPSFNSLHFNRGITFKPLDTWRVQELIESGEYREYVPFSDDDDVPEACQGLTDFPSVREHIEMYWNGADVQAVELDPPSRFDDEIADRGDAGDDDANPFVELKGEELDAIAFRGAVVTFASYETMGGEFTGTKEYRAPAGDCFTIAELHAVLEEHLGWLARCEQMQGRLNLDARFFEGLCERGGDGALFVRWGS